MKNKIIIIGLVILTTFLLVLSNLLIKKQVSKNQEVVFWTLQMNDFTPYMVDLITKFENENPGVKIKWIDVPFSEGEKRTLAAILSNNPPSLVNLNPDF